MKKLIYSLLSVLVLASCGKSFTVDGTSNVSTLDGHMLYLEVLENLEFRKIDSCEVVHGQFHFDGKNDSVRLAHIVMDDESVMFLILEEGNIQVKIDNTEQKVSGTPLNEEFSAFLSRYTQLKNEQLELLHKHDQAIMDGLDMVTVTKELSEEANRLEAEEDKYLLDFVTQNFDNVLGPSVFFMLTATYNYPMLTPWIEDVMSKATPKFKADPYVKDFYEKAKENEQIMNGMLNNEPVVEEDPITAPHTLPQSKQKEKTAE